MESATPLKPACHYLNKRHTYTPKHTAAIFILESPPQSGAYFYDPTGRTAEPLFAAMMRLIGCNPGDKASGLAAFAKQGLMIVDATYTPVNALKGKYRDAQIMASYPVLIQDLSELDPRKKTVLILIKANICRLLESRLKAEGFRVANDGIIIPFPSTGQQTNFRRQMAKVCDDWGLRFGEAGSGTG